MCGGQLGPTWRVDHFAETICQRCAGGERCWSCGAVTGGTGHRKPHQIEAARVLCARCSRTAIRTRGDLPAVVPKVRDLMRSFGIRLPNRVRVEVAASGEIESQAGPHALGYTVWTSGATVEVLHIRICGGLPLTYFGRVLAHEIGHAWLVGCAGERSARETEGLCELLGYYWLRHRGGRFSDHLVASMQANPDPLYGQGFRDAHRAAAGRHPRDVVTLVTTHGHLD